MEFDDKESLANETRDKERDVKGLIDRAYYSLIFIGEEITKGLEVDLLKKRRSGGGRGLGGEGEEKYRGNKEVENK